MFSDGREGSRETIDNLDVGCKVGEYVSLLEEWFLGYSQYSHTHKFTIIKNINLHLMFVVFKPGNYYII